MQTTQRATPLVRARARGRFVNGFSKRGRPPRRCVTGTPVCTDVKDLLGQLRFLRLSPWHCNTFFEEHARRVFGPTGNTFDKDPAPLLYMLSRVMMRHTKGQVLGGKKVLELPALSERLVRVEFTARERQAYDAARAEALAQWETVRARGTAAVSNEMLQVYSLLRPLQRLSSGGVLSAKDTQVPNLEQEAAARRAARVVAAAAAAPSTSDQGVAREDSKPVVAAVAAASEVRGCARSHTRRARSRT